VLTANADSTVGWKDFLYTSTHNYQWKQFEKGGYTTYPWDNNKYTTIKYNGTLNILNFDKTFTTYGPNPDADYSWSGS
jgi:hypothetical protein